MYMVRVIWIYAVEKLYGCESVREQVIYIDDSKSLVNQMLCLKSPFLSIFELSLIINGFYLLVLAEIIE